MSLLKPDEVDRLTGRQIELWSEGFGELLDYVFKVLARMQVPLLNVHLKHPKGKVKHFYAGIRKKGETDPGLLDAMTHEEFAEWDKERLLREQEEGFWDTVDTSNPSLKDLEPDPLFWEDDPEEE